MLALICMVETIRFRFGLALYQFFIGWMLRFKCLSVRLTFQFHAIGSMFGSIHLHALLKLLFSLFFGSVIGSVRLATPAAPAAPAAASRANRAAATSPRPLQG